VNSLTCPNDFIRCQAKPSSATYKPSKPVARINLGGFRHSRVSAPLHLRYTTADDRLLVGSLVCRASGDRAKNSMDGVKV